VARNEIPAIGRKAKYLASVGLFTISVIRVVKFVKNSVGIA
jgi:hypothetical protein